jgi:hypothetical protein
VSDQNRPQNQYPQIQIAHRADGTAEVNGVRVDPAPGQHVRDAAYAAAVALVAHCPGPVVATSVEADGAAFQLTLYPGRSVLAADLPDAADRGRRRASGFFDGIARRGAAVTPSRLPVLRLGWLMTAVIGCVLVAAMAAVLLERGDSSLVRLSVQQQKEAADSGSPQAAGSAPSAPTTVGEVLGALAQGGVAGITGLGKAASPASAARSGAGSPAPAATVPAALPGPPGQGASQNPEPGRSVPATRPARPNPAPAGSFRVEGVTLALLGGDKKSPSVTYVITVSANGQSPVTLTYTYSGSRGGATVTRSMTLSGETEYAVTGEIPGRPYCGQTVSVSAWTFPAAGSGTVSAVTTPGC